MFRIDTPTAAAALPAPSAAGTPGYFTGGDLDTGTAPTVVSSDWFNMMQEENMAVVLAANLTPSKTDNGQLLAAIKVLYGAAITAAIGALPGYSFATDSSGNWKRTFPDGSIEIGGILGTVSAEGTFSLVFPFGGFPNQFLGMSCMTINPTASGSGDTQLQEVSSTKAGITLMIQSDGASFSDATGGFRYIVKGR
jgi:hypothetical protein